MEALAIPIVGALGVGHIVARYADAPRVAGVLKPLPIAVLAVMVWQGPPLDARYSTLVVAGLVCSMVGDVCLLFPGRFVVGLASFLVAHLFYIAAFAAGAHRGTRGVTFLAPFLALAAVLIGALWRSDACRCVNVLALFLGHRPDYVRVLWVVFEAFFFYYPLLL